MISPQDRPPPLAVFLSVVGSPRFVTALTASIIGTAVLCFLLRTVIGWPGLLAILSLQIGLALASMIARRGTIEWQGILPVSLIVFLGWAALSAVWSNYTWVTVGGLAYLLCFTVLGIYVALLRDTIQIVRSFGDVLRVVLTASLAIEIFAGVLIDSPIPFLEILGKLDELGPIQGFTGARNQLGILAVVALITFGIEMRTKSVARGLSIGSLVLAGILLALTQSPLASGSLVVVAAAAAALYGLRRAQPDRRRMLQLGILVFAVILATLAWIARLTIVQVFNGTGELTYRLRVWRRAWDLIALNPLEGWGWIGTWRTDIAPFGFFGGLGSRTPTSASNAFIDVWLQLGLVGLVLFVGLVGLAFVRSWLLASRQRSVVFAWPALVLVVLVTTSLAESSMLAEFGWLTFVACTVKAAHHLSWRKALAG
ncbi:O-antigen ligase family protein [Salinibacterium sp. G-O1]|uniref:O-antigen ligase family protein n=1 Tax=Salinibacterium sp. G-O1 TaxID=3046208 RepID=UPI0024B9B55B|nr:O-antigen ligase family protein [Salinibacterium sp. G-O1]MDJ0336533.1 O-antigen ligase family protein [Salinibacterium sp. G-O1]